MNGCGLNSPELRQTDTLLGIYPRAWLPASRDDAMTRQECLGCPAVLGEEEGPTDFPSQKGGGEETTVRGALPPGFRSLRGTGPSGNITGSTADKKHGLTSQWAVHSLFHSYSQRGHAIGRAET